MNYTQWYAQNGKLQKHELWIKDNIVLETIMGSRAYGVETKDSDYDIARKSPLSPTPQREKLHNLLMECLEHEFGSEEKMKSQTSDYVSSKDVMDKLELIEKKIGRVGFTSGRTGPV